MIDLDNVWDKINKYAQQYKKEYNNKYLSTYNNSIVWILAVGKTELPATKHID